MSVIDDQIHRFDEIDRVVADSLRFKLKLGIGSDAYASMRVGKTLQELWDVGGVAATGAGFAASSTVAGTFFSTTGWLSAIGLGATAVTPLGWVIGAAFASGGAYYGVTRLFKGYGQSRVDTIPKFINTPIDLLGASLMDLLGTLSVKMAAFDGEIDHREIETAKNYFVEEWGFDTQYTNTAFQYFQEKADDTKLVDIAKALVEFAKSNPDCNFAAISQEILTLMESVALADGKLDEREELALEKVSQILSEAASLKGSIANAVPSTKSITKAPKGAGKWVKDRLFRPR